MCKISDIDRMIELPAITPSSAADAETVIVARRISLAKWIYWSRGVRPGVADGRLFGEPAWDLVIDLYIHQKKGVLSDITAACAGSRAPSTTALRYIDVLGEFGWVEKIRDEIDRRRSLLELTPLAIGLLDTYFDRMFDALWMSFPDHVPSKRQDGKGLERKRA